MRIESFWARGFRSLRDVRLDGLGPFNVLYGPNGAGKSNLLAAMNAWQQLVAHALAPRFDEATAGNQAFKSPQSPLRRHDFSLHGGAVQVVLGGTLVELDDGLPRVLIELTLDISTPQPLLTRRLILGDDLFPEQDSQCTEAQREKLAALQRVDWTRTLSLVAADRMPRLEPVSARPPAEAEPLSWYFRRGQLKDALFAAQNSSSAATARALDRFRRLLAGPPLHRAPFRSVEDPHTGIRDLREWLPPPLDAHDISLDLAGLGIAQIYWILGQAMLSGARAVAIEEPEAHLHAPTSGRALRQLLARLVEEKHVDQLFVATHSNLFDLDPTGYLDVSLRDGATVVERADLARIDRDHLYEPGPAKHALQRMLTYTPADEVVFRRPDGAAVTAREMLALLQADDDLAVRFLGDVHGAALRVVKLNAGRAKAG